MERDTNLCRSEPEPIPVRMYFAYVLVCVRAFMRSCIASKFEMNLKPFGEISNANVRESLGIAYVSEGVRACVSISTM